MVQTTWIVYRSNLPIFLIMASSLANVAGGNAFFVYSACEIIRQTDLRPAFRARDAT